MGRRRDAAAVVPVHLLLQIEHVRQTVTEHEERNVTDPVRRRGGEENQRAVPIEREAVGIPPQRPPGQEALRPDARDDERDDDEVE